MLDEKDEMVNIFNYKSMAIPIILIVSIRSYTSRGAYEAFHYYISTHTTSVVLGWPISSSGGLAVCAFAFVSMILNLNV